MVARNGVTSTDNDFEVVALVPEDVKIALWTRIFQYLLKYAKLKKRWWAISEQLRFIKKRRDALNAEIDRELAQGSAKGSRDGLQR